MSQPQTLTIQQYNQSLSVSQGILKREHKDEKKRWPGCREKSDTNENEKLVDGWYAKCLKTEEQLTPAQKQQITADVTPSNLIQRFKEWLDLVFKNGIDFHRLCMIFSIGRQFLCQTPLREKQGVALILSQLIVERAAKWVYDNGGWGGVLTVVALGTAGAVAGGTVGAAAAAAAAFDVAAGAVAGAIAGGVAGVVVAAGIVYLTK